MNDKIKDFINSHLDLNIGIYATPEDIQIQLNTLANTIEEAEIVLDGATEQLKDLLGIISLVANKIL